MSGIGNFVKSRNMLNVHDWGNCVHWAGEMVF